MGVPAREAGRTRKEPTMKSTLLERRSQWQSLSRQDTTEELIEAAARRVVELDWVKKGERVGITAGLPSGHPKTTSLLQIQEV